MRHSALLAFPARAVDGEQKSPTLAPGCRSRAQQMYYATVQPPSLGSPRPTAIVSRLPNRRAPLRTAAARRRFQLRCVRSTYIFLRLARSPVARPSLVLLYFPKESKVRAVALNPNRLPKRTLVAARGEGAPNVVRRAVLHNDIPSSKRAKYTVSRLYSCAREGG